MAESLAKKPSFTGTDGIEAEMFIQQVRRAAFHEGKLRDDAWMADFAATCLSGEALRWHSTLDKDVRRDWIKLESAILEKYPVFLDSMSDLGKPEPEHQAPKKPKPDGVGAVPPPSTVTRASTSWSYSFMSMIFGFNGRIKVVTNIKEMNGYVARSPTRWGHLASVQGKAGSVQATFVDGGSKKNYLKLLNSTMDHEWLGIQWCCSPFKVGKEGAALVGVTGDDNEDVAGSSRWSKGPTGAGIWQVGPDGQLIVTWVDGEDTHVLTPLTRTKDREIFFATDATAFTTKSKYEWLHARLYFEPMHHRNLGTLLALSTSPGNSQPESTTKTV
ncbi:hypothetical protein FS837_000483 [Tulasnella sp. UAMH 9824]|nr:hypothetical protein FS837_000483 [Tulasnella sp. UAMH 9824]